MKSVKIKEQMSLEVRDVFFRRRQVESANVPNSEGII